jgi:hypothetical protein
MWAASMAAAVAFMVAASTAAGAVGMEAEVGGMVAAVAGMAADGEAQPWLADWRPVHCWQLPMLTATGTADTAGA